MNKNSLETTISSVILVKKAKSTKKDNPELLSREASRRPKAF